MPLPRVVHGTLTPNVVTSVTLAGETAQLTVLNRSQNGEIYFTVDGSTPSVLGIDSYVCLGARAVEPWSVALPPTVRMISTAALNYSVTSET